MSPLEAEIRNRISTEGPLSIADFMALCLTHPEHGYYTTSTPVGGRASTASAGGDFITAPEVSQMFGELIGVWCMEIWQTLGSPDPFNLVEIGPGRGTLMKDLLRAGNALPGFLSAADVHLVEISTTLAEQQRRTLSDQKVPLKWLRDVGDLSDTPTIIIANELLDALPFRQWVKHNDQWHERAVDQIEDALTFTIRPNRLDLNDVPPGHVNHPNGSIFETAPVREGFIAAIADRLTSNNGAALFIDYGHIKSGFGDTLQAMQDHKFVDPLAEPGRSDLTSHVDFEPLLSIARTAGCTVPKAATQGEFLLNLGLLERAGRLGTGQSPEVQKGLQTVVERLAGPGQMGKLFKVMAFGTLANPVEQWPGFS